MGYWIRGKVPKTVHEAWLDLFGREIPLAIAKLWAASKRRHPIDTFHATIAYRRLPNLVATILV